jgi:hypothetical protein
MSGSEARSSWSTLIRQLSPPPNLLPRKETAYFLLHQPVPMLILGPQRAAGPGPWQNVTGISRVSEFRQRSWSASHSACGWQPAAWKCVRMGLGYDPWAERTAWWWQIVCRHTARFYSGGTGGGGACFPKQGNYTSPYLYVASDISVQMWRKHLNAKRFVYARVQWLLYVPLVTTLTEALNFPVCL